MAADVPVKPDVVNSCCTAWIDKYSRLEQRRLALRSAVDILKPQIEIYHAENERLKKALEEEQARADIEKEEKVKESAARVSLENEISRLMSEILSLKQGGNADTQDKNEAKLLKAHVSEGEKEINHLKELLEREKKRADSESKNAEVEKKKAAKARKAVKAEQSKADEERKCANIEGEKAENYRLQLEVLKKEADKAKSNLASETLKLVEANKKLEAEKQKVVKERKCANSEMAKAEEQKKLVEANSKKAMEEKCHAESLSLQLVESRKRIDELKKEINEIRCSRDLPEAPGGTPENNKKGLASKEILMRDADELKLVLEHPKYKETKKRYETEKQKAIKEKKRAESEMVKTEKQKKLAEVNWKKAMEEKSRADQLSGQLDEAKKKIEELQRKINEFFSSRKLIEVSAVELDKGMGAENAKVRLLKKQLKFEKMQTKHAKEVVKLEKSRNSILQQELGRLKLELDQFSQRLGMLNKSLSHSAEGIDDPEKTWNMINMQRLNMKNYDGLDSLQMNLRSGIELLKPSCPVSDTSDLFSGALQHAPFLALSGGNCTESISGIDSKLESLVRGSNRKMLQSSAINSSTASFSDRQLVGSQEKGAFSVTASEKLVEENVQPTISNLSAEVTKMKCNENVAVVAENSVRSPVRTDGVGRINDHSRKRKRIIDAVESIEDLYCEGKKLHLQLDEKLSVLHCLLSKQTVKPFEEGRYLLLCPQGNSYAKHERLYEKKAVLEEKLVMQNCADSNEQKKADGFENEVCGCANVYQEVSENANELIGIAQASREGISDFVSDFETMTNFDEITDGNYLKLLDLDNAADEERYRMAMERPLSPALPEIKVPGVEASDADYIKPLIKETFCEGLSNKEEKQSPPYSFDVIDVEINSNNLNNSLFGKNGGHIVSFDTLGKNGNGSGNSLAMGKACDLQVQNSDAELMSDALISRNKDAIFPFGVEVEYAGDSILKCYVAFSNITDSSSISRIHYASRTCITQCSLATHTEWMVREILFALNTEEKLSHKEKVCVFFSLLLLNFSTVASSKFGNLNWNSNPCLDSFAQHMCSVMSDAEVRSIFAEFGCLDESLSLIEDFLIDGEVVVCKDASSETSVKCCSRFNILLDGLHISSRSASEDDLVAGSIVLASICSAFDQIGFICETSYSILRSSRFSHSLVLTILHVFAHLGGVKFFSFSNNLMTVMKSLVTFHEGVCLSDSAGRCIPSVRNSRTEFCPCAKCPFSEDAVSVDTATSLLLEKLQNNALLGTMYQDVMISGNSNSNSRLLFNKYKAEQTANPDNCKLDVQCDVSCCLNKHPTSAIQSDSSTNFTLCNLSDLLSLVELIAFNMSWEWTNAKVVPRLLKILESCEGENVIAGIVALLGQLGRLGVNALGYEDKGVEILRLELSAFLCRDAAISVGLPTQIAAVTALLGLMSCDFETIVHSNVKPPVVATQSGPAQTIRKWFSLLPKKQQDLSFSLLDTAGVNKT